MMLAAIKGFVSVDTLGLETVLIAVPVTPEVGVASPGHIDNGITDGVAFSGDIIAVETDVGAGEVEEGSESESDGVGVHFGGVA